MADSEVKLVITTDTAKAISEINRFSQQSAASLKKVEQQTTTLSKTFSSFLGNLGASAAIAAVDTVTSSMSSLFNLIVTDGINAAVEYQDAMNQLSFSFSTVGIRSREVLDDFDAFASQLEKTSKFTDDQIVSNAAYLQSLAGLSANGLKVATQAAVDFASATGKDLGTAIDLLVKAASGSVVGFSKLGIEIKKGKTDAETFANTLRQLGQFTGAGKAAIDTFSGAVSLLTKSFNNFVKEIGNLIINDPLIRSFIKNVAELFTKLAEGVKATGSLSGLLDAITGRVNKLITRIFSLGVAFSTAFVITNFDATLTAIKKITPAFETAKTSVLEFGQSIKSQLLIFQELKAQGYSTLESVRLGFRSGEVAVKLFTLAVNIAKAALTLGLTLALDQVITKFLELREKGNGVLASLSGAIDSLGATILNIFSEVFAALAKLFDNNPFTKFIADSLNFLAEGSKKIANEVSASVENVGKAAFSAGAAIGLSIKKPIEDATLFAKTKLPEITDAVLQIAAKAGSDKSFNLLLEKQNQDLEAALANRLITEEQYNLQKLVGQQEAEQKIIDERMKQQELLLQAQGLSQEQLLQSKISYLDSELALEGNSASRILALNQSKNKLVTENNKKMQDQQLKDQQTFFSAATTLQNAKTKELAMIGKAAAITEIAIKTPQAVAASFQFGTGIAGPALGFILAGIAATAMAAQAAAVAGVPLATGLTEVPKGFPNDTFKANLTSGERVINVAQNKDLTTFLADQEKRESDEETVGWLQTIAERLGQLENTTIVNVGNREIIREVREGLRSGRQLVAT